MKVLAVSPEYQGKGCASTLLEAGIGEVDVVGAKSFLEATPQAHSLYLKYGWRDLDFIVSDLAKYDCGAQHEQITTGELYSRNMFSPSNHIAKIKTY